MSMKMPGMRAILGTGLLMVLAAPCLGEGAERANTIDLLRKELARIVRLRGDEYYSEMDKAAVRGKERFALLAVIVKDEKAPVSVRILAETIVVRAEKAEEFGKAHEFARSLRRIAKEENLRAKEKRREGEEKRQRERARKEAARNRWRKETAEKLNAMKVGEMIRIASGPEGEKEFQAQRTDEKTYRVRDAKDKRTWGDWEKAEEDENVELSTFNGADELLSFFDVSTVGVGGGGGGTWGSITGGNRPRRGLPKDISLLETKTGRLVMLEIILSSLPETGWARKNKDVRARVTPDDQAAIIEVLALDDKVDDQLVHILNRKMDEGATRKDTHAAYWDMVIQYLSKHKSKSSVPCLVKWLKVEAAHYGTRPIRARIARALAIIGGGEAEAALVNLSRSRWYEIREEAAEALACLGTWPARRRLREMMSSDPSENVRETAKVAYNR